VRLALYCRELRGGGARAVGIGLIKALAARSWGHEIFAYVPDDPGFRALEGGSVLLVPVATPGGWRQALAHADLRRRLTSDRPDALFMMGNRGLAGSICPQAVLIHNPWAVYPDSPAWGKCSWRGWAYRRVRNAFFSRGLRCAEVVATQTPVMIGRVHHQFGIPLSRLALIPNSVTSPAEGSSAETTTSQAIRAAPHAHRAVCLARHYTHKNIEILLDVADLLLGRGRTDLGLFVTVDASHGHGARQFLAERVRKGRHRVLHNLGQIPMGHVASCYAAIDALLLPTLLESFTNTYVDAMSTGVPVITSNLDFARTICGGAACYVDPLDPDAIVAALDSLAAEPDAWRERVSLGRERARTMFIDWETIAARVVDMLECVAVGRGVGHLLDVPWVREVIDVSETVAPPDPGPATDADRASAREPGGPVFVP
jgi:glycosyltransferase involved in cell wall biosynthesis